MTRRLLLLPWVTLAWHPAAAPQDEQCVLGPDSKPKEGVPGGQVIPMLPFHSTSQKMAAALRFAGWDYHFVFGEDTHDGHHMAAIFPDAMRWLWRRTP